MYCVLFLDWQKGVIGSSNYRLLCMRMARYKRVSGERYMYAEEA